MIGGVALLIAVAALVGRRSDSLVASAPEAGLAYPIPPRDGRILVEVLNTTDRVGLARTATRLLRQEGIDVLSSGNDGPALTQTRVVVRRGDVANGRIVARALGIGEVVQDTDTLRRVDVSVFLGTDYAPKSPLHP